MKIVETSNFGDDYPNEKFVELPPLQDFVIETICTLINLRNSGDSAPRYWKVVEDDYKLQPGFEP